jgi:hypothetical protein
VRAASVSVSMPHSTASRSIAFHSGDDRRADLCQPVAVFGCQRRAQHRCARCEYLRLLALTIRSHRDYRLHIDVRLHRLR